MFRNLLLIGLVGVVSLIYSQNDYLLRSAADTTLAPFYHGVASGDPTPNAVIIWTRVTTTQTGTINGKWRMATDTNFINMVQQGLFSTDSSRDYTVKIDITGLQPNTWYFYEFEYDGKMSIRGRTKTAPIGGIEQLRFAFVSCSNYPAGFFNAYDRLWERNDIDAVLHLGDYIYEYGRDEYGNKRKDVLPEHEIITLADYRLRHSTYKLDSSLRKLHQQYPFITVWDDHETANDSYKDGAENHSPTSEGPWSLRKSNGQRAYEEWLPIRLPEQGNNNKIWRKFSYGNLVDVFMLDTRLYDRSLQDKNNNDTTKKLLGNEQFAWLETELKNSTAKWKVLAQQVMMGNLNPFGLVVNNDQWDGYPLERKKLYDIILNNNIKNMIVLTGDIHTAWAMDLPYNQNTYNPSTGNGSVGVEFVCTSITSTSSPIPLDQVSPIVSLVLPHIKYVDFYRKGYGILDLQSTQAQGDFYSVYRIDKIDTIERFERGYYTLDNTRWLKKATSASSQQIANIHLAPPLPRTDATTPIRSFNNNSAIIGLYPNPFVNDIILQYNIFQTGTISIEIVDLLGRKIIQQDLGIQAKGLHQYYMDVKDLPSGMYKLLLKNNNGIIEKSIQKF